MRRAALDGICQGCSVCVCAVCVMLRVDPLKSETGWTRDNWLQTNLQKKIFPTM